MSKEELRSSPLTNSNSEEWIKKIEGAELSKEELLELTESPLLKVKLKAIEKLKNFPGDCEVMELLREELIFDPDWEVKWASLKTLGYLMEEPILQKLGSSLGEERIKALRKLVREKRRELAFAIYALLDDDREEVIAEAIKAVEELELSEGIKYIILLYKNFSPLLKEMSRGVIKKFSEQKKFEDFTPFQREKIEEIVSDNSAQIRCFRCNHRLDWKNIYKVGTWRAGVILLCKYHYEEFVENEGPFEGKFYNCWYCSTYWPKYQVIEKACPQCRQKRFEELPPPKNGNFRCHLCHKENPLSRRSPIKMTLGWLLGKVGEDLLTKTDLEEEVQLCNSCTVHLASESPRQPYFSDRAIQLLRAAEEQGLFICDNCKRTLPIEEREEGKTFRDYSICRECAKKE